MGLGPNAVTLTGSGHGHLWMPKSPTRGTLRPSAQLTGGRPSSAPRRAPTSLGSPFAWQEAASEGRAAACSGSITRSPPGACISSGLRGREGAGSMAQPEPTPVPSCWPLMLLLLLSGTTPPGWACILPCSRDFWPGLRPPAASHLLPPSPECPWGPGAGGQSPAGGSLVALTPLLPAGIRLSQAWGVKEDRRTPNLAPVGTAWGYRKETTPGQTCMLQKWSPDLRDRVPPCPALSAVTI